MADPSTLAASSTTMWALMAGWLTPTSLFLLLNIMIGTILISSRFHGPSSSDKQPFYGHHPQAHSGDHPPPLARAPSLLDRVRSINFSAYRFDHHHRPDDVYHFPAHDQVQHHEGHLEPADHQFDPPPLARAPSLLQRLKSVNFAPYIFDHPAPPTTVPEPEYVPSVEPPQLARAPSLLQRLKSINLSPYRYNHPEPVPAQAYSEPARTRPVRAEPPPVAPVPSFLERVKSINFSLYGQEEPDLAGHVDQVDHQVKRVNSDTKPTGGEAPLRLPRKMRKSASDKSAFGHFRPEEDEEEEEEEEEVGVELRRPEAAVPEAQEIDAKADDFINRFKQQLKLQRLDSIMRYRELLGRGSAT